MTEQAGRFETATVLKSDTFSTIERGTWTSTDGASRPAVRRTFGDVAWWVTPIAVHFARRETRALKVANGLGAGPDFIADGPGFLVRGWLDGLPLHTAKPHGRAAWFRSAREKLRRLHRAGIVHNDLAKEQNWLVGPHDAAFLTDFQLAAVFTGRSKLFRVLAHEDLRHLLKHKRRYCPEALTSAEHRMLARKSLFARVWLKTGKKVYNAITRGILDYEDREGGGLRLSKDGPAITAALEAHAEVRKAAIVAYPFPRRGVGLYAFAETDTLSNDALRAHLNATLGAARCPDLVQAVVTLPRRADGTIHDEVLRLVALNQLDLIDTLAETDAARAATHAIIAGRLNLKDRT